MHPQSLPLISGDATAELAWLATGDSAYHKHLHPTGELTTRATCHPPPQTALDLEHGGSEHVDLYHFAPALMGFCFICMFRVHDNPILLHGMYPTWTRTTADLACCQQLSAAVAHYCQTLLPRPFTSVSVVFYSTISDRCFVLCIV